jgi:hypothetical protein
VAAASLTASHCLQGLKWSSQPQSLQNLAPAGLWWLQKPQILSPKYAARPANVQGGGHDEPMRPF